ncbi:hypothetical protein B4065_1109 [Caldibacillus thermoamylovorans]|nr:hypothetical protein B4065_1109 [Caldibacillus thermoamylovorans]
MLFLSSLDPLWPGLVDLPLLAAILGAIFVGVGSGLCVRFGIPQR